MKQWFWCAILVLVSACGTSPQPLSAEQRLAVTQLEAQLSAPLRTFVGRLEGTDAFVAVTLRAQQVEVYVCDGTDAGVTISEWLEGTLVENRISATSVENTGSSLVAELVAGQLSGRLTLTDGSSRAFTLELARAPAGLWNTVGQGADQASFRAAWIVLPDLEQRGATRTRPARGAGLVNPSTGSNVFQRPARNGSNFSALEASSDLPQHCQDLLNELKQELAQVVPSPTNLDLIISSWDIPFPENPDDLFLSPSCQEITGIVFPPLP